MSETTPGSAAAPRHAEGGSSIFWGRWLVWVGLFTILGILGLGLIRARAGQVSSGSAPDFEFTTFDGQQIRLSDLRGQVVVINFWASWCEPCRQEAMDLELTWREYREKGVVFVGLNWADTEREAKAYLQEFDITYPNGPDLGTRIAQTYRMNGIPETFFIDRQGQLQGVHVGPINRIVLHRRIDAYLDTGP